MRAYAHPATLPAMRGIIVLAALLATCASAWGAKIPFVFEERPGHNYSQGESVWRDALLRATVGGCKERFPRGARLRPRIRDCVVTQVHVTNQSHHALDCHIMLILPTPDDAGRTHIEHSIRIEPRRERWVATAYGPASLVPSSFETSCAAAA
jgi:hypothetical protein